MAGPPRMASFLVFDAKNIYLRSKKISFAALHIPVYQPALANFSAFCAAARDARGG
jgi:hypothetical protein